MLKTIITHELKNVLLTPKFTITFAITSILILLSVFLGIKNFQYSIKQYETVNRLSDQELREKSEWMSLSTKIHRKPDPLEIFVSGVSNDIGRYSGINSFRDVKLTHSNYSDEPVYAVFRFIDFTFIVTIVLTLFTILFTYDAVNGESEKGTLRLLFANPVPRKTFILGKFLGTWLGLLLPLLIPILLSILMVLIWNVPFTSEHWGRFALLIFASLSLYTLFIVLGLLISTLTRRSSVSFLISLAVWIIFVFIIPRMGIMMAGQLVPVPGFAEIQGKQSQYEKERWDKYMNDSQIRWEKRNNENSRLSPGEEKSIPEEKMWEYMEEEDKERKQVERDITLNNRNLIEEYRNKKSSQEKLGFVLSRFSPVSAFQLAVMNTAGTDINMKTRFEDDLQRYRNDFIDYKEKKHKESGEVGGMRIMFSPSGLKIETSRDKGSLNISDMPHYTISTYSFNNVISSAALDIGLIIMLSFLLFGAAYLKFLRYDVR